VNRRATKVTLASSINPSTAGQKVAFTATISPAATGGTMAFLDGSAPLGSVAVSNGSALLSVSTLSGGDHSITAVYSGDANSSGSTSAILGQTVRKNLTKTQIQSSPNPSAHGQAVTLSATVSPNSAKGTIEFLEGSKALGTVSVNGGGAALSISTLPAGTHSITAVYSGDGNNSSSTSPALTQTVNKTTPTLTLTGSPNAAAKGQKVTFNATVFPSSATGTVRFLDGSATVGTAVLTSGTASLSVSTLAVGSHSITAVYSGDVNDSAATSAVLKLTVTVVP
jgi:hypothetical protein